MSADLPNLPRTSSTDLSKLRRLIPVKIVDPATSGFIDILVSRDCVPTIDRLLPPDRQAALARLIAAHPEVAKTLAKVEGGHDKQLSYQGVIVSFWDVRDLGHIIIYHVGNEEGSPPSGPPDKKLNPYWVAAIVAAISAAVREIGKRIPDIFQRHTAGDLLLDRRPHVTVSIENTELEPRPWALNVLYGSEQIIYAPCHATQAAHQSKGILPSFRKTYRNSTQYSPFGVTTYIWFCWNAAGYPNDWILEREFDHLQNNSYSSDFSMRVGIGMLNSSADRTAALRNAIAELRLHVAGIQPLRCFTVPLVPAVDVRAVRLLTKQSPERFAALLRVSLDELISWECGESHPNIYQARVLSLLEFYPEEVIRELGIAERHARLH